jgi:hypothetical protein
MPERSLFPRRNPLAISISHQARRFALAKANRPFDAKDRNRKCNVHNLGHGERAQSYLNSALPLH